jgi:NADH-quinone oxidoreductase subunit E
MSVRRLADEQPESFEFTPQNLAWAKKLIAKYPQGRQASAVIPLLWRAQEQHDYWLPRAAIEQVADMLGMNKLRVLEVATFYTMFNLAPVGRHFIQLCGTPPCHLVGAPRLRKMLEERIGPQQHVTSDGNFSWLEVECLGACCNGPMVQINNDYYEDLSEENFARLLDDLAAGRPVKKGSQIGRVSSEPEPGKGTTLTDPALYDGSRLGAWRSRFDDADAGKGDVGKGDVGKSEAGKSEAGKSEATAAGAASEPTRAAKPDRPSAVVPESAIGSGPAAHLAGPEASAPKHEALDRSQSGAAPGGAAAVGAGQAGSAQDRAAQDRAAQEQAARDAAAAAEEEAIRSKLATLSKDATAEEKANAVGRRPAGLAGARGGIADDLKRIKGIGKVNEGRLNELGVFHFDQIAAWSREEIRWVGTYLAFPGRIDREAWTQQASALANGEETEFSRRVDKGEVATSQGGPSRPDKVK